MIKNLQLSILFSLIIIISLGCSTNNSNHVEIINELYISESEYQYYLHKQGQGQAIAETLDGYYLRNGSYIYYMDKAKMKPVLLESNPNHDCSVDKVQTEINNCNALINNQFLQFRGSVTYYNNELYITQVSEYYEKDSLGIAQYELVKMNLDGTQRKVIKQFDSSPVNVVIHKDQVYYIQNTSNDVEQRGASIYTFPLKKPNSEPIALYSANNSDFYFMDINAYGDDLFFVEVGPNMYRQIIYNLLSGESIIMYENNEGSNIITSMHNDKLYFSLFTGEHDEDSWVQYESEITGQQIQALPFQIPIVSFLYKDDNYYYLLPSMLYTSNPDFAHVKKEMIIYDLNYVEVMRVDMSHLHRITDYFVGNDQHMFFISSNTNNEHVVDEFYYLDKSKIKSGKAKIELLVESAVQVYSPKIPK